MGSKTSILIYVTLAVLILLLVSHSPKKPSHHRHRRLKLRSNFSAADINRPHHHEPVPFDPLVADIERHREDKQWEKDMMMMSKEIESAPGAESQPEWEDFMNAEDYLNDEEKFNVTDRLVLLFPKIDVDPTDGYATEGELTDWILKNSQREVMHRTQREMELHDKNRDGFVSFTEYEPPGWVRSSDNTAFGYEMGWWREEHFNASDADGDGLLNITEFNDFQHPADSKNPKLLHWLCQEEIRLEKALREAENHIGVGITERDSDRDGKVNFKEFFHGLFDFVRNYDEEGHSPSHESDNSAETPARKLFAELDKDGDGYLSDAELLPIMGKLHPSERYYAKQQADYIISQADADKDGHLTLKEMIDSPYVFYSAIFNEDDEDDYEYHDEFR